MKIEDLLQATQVTKSARPSLFKTLEKTEVIILGKADGDDVQLLYYKSDGDEVVLVFTDKKYLAEAVKSDKEILTQDAIMIKGAELINLVDPEAVLLVNPWTKYELEFLASELQTVLTENQRNSDQEGEP